MKQNKIYIAAISIVFLAITIVFDFLPRSTYSPLEKRDLTVFPEFSLEELASGEYTKKISSWFSDTEPYRDTFLSLSMAEKDWIGISYGEEDIKFHAAKDEGPSEEELEANERNVGKYKNELNANDIATIANRGIVVVGKGEKVRALMAYGGGPDGGVEYAKSANEYKKAFPDVNIYCMVIPTAIEFYCPDKVKKVTRDQQPTINNIYAHLDKGVRAVDIYTPLSQHVTEDIYLRTDHHWAPLGAYYAAERFCQVAGVPFKPLSFYEQRVVHRYVGSMYGYSKDASIRNNPEDFVFYVPKGLNYTTTYIDYQISKDYKVAGEKAPRQGEFFVHYADGSDGAYCTFMGGDSHLTKVQTGNPNHRRVMILKDSFGNAIPGYLFYSFEEVHVVDFRYFTKNMKEYVRQNKITDILFANNIFNAYSSKICSRYMEFLSQKSATPAPSSKPSAPKAKAPKATPKKPQAGTAAGVTK